MVTLLDIAGQQIKDAAERLEKTSVEEHAADLGVLSTSLLKNVREGTATVAEIDDFLRQNLQLASELKQFLISEKAWLLLGQGSAEEALKRYDEALDVNRKSPVTWARKGAALLQLSRPDEAFNAFQEAYSLRENFGNPREGYLKDLFQGWSTGAFLDGLAAILEESAQKLGAGVHEYLEVQEKASNEGIAGTEVILVRGEDYESVPQELRDAVEEWELAVKLLSIKDPFERARILAKEVSKVWPEGVSAVEAVREQRDREWNL